MKKILIFYLLITTAKIGTAQSYQSIFGKDSTTWVIMWSNLGFTTDANFSILSDTIYKSKAYKVIGFPGLNFALIREDTLTGQIWSVDLLCDYGTDSLERLVSDMSLQIGDSFSLSGFFGETGLDTISVVDSVYYVQGQKRLRLSTPFIPSSGIPITLIEGIGPNYSLLYKVGNDCSGYSGKYLQCVFKDGVKADYTSLLYNGECYPTFEGVADLALGKIDISPNPANNQLLISANGLLPQTITICNLNGQQVINTPFVRKVDISALPPGVYFVEVSGAQGTEIKKLVKM